MMKLVRYVLAICIVLLLSSVVYAQDFMNEAEGGKAEEIKERVMQFKKIKLLEMLKLNGEAADKFIVKYNDGQKKIDDAKKQLDDAIKDLHQAVKRGAAQSDITTKTDNVARLYDAWNNATRDRVAVFKSMLTPEQFAQLMMFEIKFPEVLMKMIIRKGARKGAQSFGND